MFYLPLLANMVYQVEKGRIHMGLFDDLADKFAELEDGKYVVKIEGYVRERTKNNLMPIRWNLTLVDDTKGLLPTKFSHVDHDVGFRILMNELKALGYKKPKSPAEFEAILQSLIGCLVEVELITTDREEEFRMVRFVRKVYDKHQ
jgi:hypothetical protein